MLGTIFGMGLGQVVTPAPAKGLTVDRSPVPADTVTLKSLESSLGFHASKRLPHHKYR
jgi:hypothetical protein